MSQILVADQTLSPYRSVVYIETTFSDGATIAGSGVMVGVNDVLTAGHMVYQVQHGGAAASVKVIPAYDPNPFATPYGTYTSTSFHYLPGVDPDGNGSFASGNLGPGLGGSELDVAVIDLSTAVGNATGWMNMDPSFRSGTVNVTGYPSTFGFNMTTVTGTVQESSSDSTLFYTGGIEVFPGNSGGPVWYQGSDGQYVVGVVSTTKWAADIDGTYTTIKGWITGNDYLIAGATVSTTPPPATTPPPTTTTPPPATAPTADPTTTLWSGATSGDDAINATTGNDIVFTGGGNDRVSGLAGHDYLLGGAGNDYLDGGTGNDKFNGGTGSDRLVGGEGIDTAIYGARAGYDVKYVSGSVVVTATATGDQDTLSGVERLRFSDSYFLTEPVKTQVDFGTDGRGDILLRNLVTSEVQIKSMNGASVSDSQTVSYIPSQDWSIMGTGDFDGDGRSDILWRNDNGIVGIWHMNGSQFASGGNVVGRPEGWNIVGTGDFDGDHKSDILWRSDSGAIGIWDRQLVTMSNGGVVTPLGNDWKVSGTGDFNGDGKSDILWANQSGSISVWLMNGLTLMRGGVMDAKDAWMAGTGDFNGDGKTDILWRQPNGDVGMWFMNGSASSSGGTVKNVSNDWTIAGIGDFNADHRADILWQDAGGALKVDLMNGLSVVGSGALGTIGGDWIVA
jgi:V8-like Glu-specific endopeptidase